MLDDFSSCPEERVPFRHDQESDRQCGVPCESSPSRLFLRRQPCLLLRFPPRLWERNPSKARPTVALPLLYAQRSLLKQPSPKKSRSRPRRSASITRSSLS